MSTQATILYNKFEIIVLKLLPPFLGPLSSAPIGLNKMAAILQMTFSNTFFYIKMSLKCVG